MSTDPHLQQLVSQHFRDAAQAAENAVNSLSEPILGAAQLVIDTLLNNHRIYACGNGGAAADAEYLVAQLIGRLEQERPGLPAIALSVNSSTLTALCNDYSYSDVFARQIRGLGNSGDVLFAISTSGSSTSILQAVIAAHQREIRVIALTNETDGQLVERLNREDCLIAVNATRTMRVRELHRISIHAICDVIDSVLLGAM